MSDKDLPATRQRKGRAPLDLEEHSIYREKVLDNLLSKLKPWLFEFGVWIFGGLIALNIWIMATLINIGPVEPAILVSIAIFACALPMNVAGLFSLKLIKDMNEVAIDEMMRQAIEDSHIPDSVTSAPGLKQPAEPAQERTETGLRYSMWLVVVSAGLTVLGMIAALWHMAWWVAVLFAAMVIVSAFVAVNVLASAMRPKSRLRRQ